MKRSNPRLVLGLSVLTALGCGDDSKTDNVCAPTADASATGPSIGTERGDAGSDARAASATGDATVGSSNFPFSPSNVDLGALPALPAAGLTISSVCQFDSEAGTFQCVGNDTHDGQFNFSVATSAGSGRVGILRTRKLQIDVAGQLQVHGSLPLIVLAEDDMQIAGVVSATAERGKTWAGGFAGSTVEGPGTGPGAGKLGSGENTQFDASSGAGYCGVGGTGATKDPAKPGAVGGLAYGSPTLIPLIGGSSGGGEEGGPGGGAVQLVSATQITIASTGAISAGGAGGGNGSSGGGAGGSILLEAPSVSVLGVLAANGGG
ncbi:MAG: hypothetical protein JWN04_3619, partial [Myxococcaceae bacterium]|nr:hypothetical protein [Myxococcaceae bacterium]